MTQTGGGWRFVHAAWRTGEENNLPPCARLVLLALARHADHDGECFPSVPRLAGLVGLSTRQVQRYLRDLAERGLVDIERKRGRANHYTLTLDAYGRGDVRDMGRHSAPLPRTLATPTPDMGVRRPLTPVSATPDTSVPRTIQELEDRTTNETARPARDEAAPGGAAIPASATEVREILASREVEWAQEA